MIGKFCSFILLIIFVLSNSVYADWETPETGTSGPVGSVVSQGSYVFAGSSSAGVFISANDGNQWIERNEGITTTDVQQMAVIGNSLFAATNGAGVFKSVNSGESWTVKNNGLGNYSVYSLFANNSNLYAVTDESGVFMSSDEGENWISLNNGDIIGIICYTVTESNGKVYVGAQFGNLYTTTDLGATWENLKSGPLAFNIKSIDIKDDKILVGTNSGVFISDDSGSNWRVLNAGLKSFDIKQVKFVTNNSIEYIYAATNGGGIYISENYGVSWVAVNQGLQDLNILSFGFHGEYIFAGSQFSPVARRKMSEMVVPEVKPPVLVSPIDNSENNSPNVTFIWKESDGAKSYTLQIARSTDFSNPIVEKGDLQTPTANQTLEKGLQYYWRVAAISDKNEKKWSEVWMFTTRDEQAAPILVSPSNMESNVSRKPTFSWEPSTGTVSYQIQVSKNDEFTELIFNQVNIATTSTTMDDELDESTIYYWRIASVGFDEEKMLSETWSFSTGEYNSVYEYLSNGKDSKIQLYPNPVTQEMNLRFNTSFDKIVLSIISLNGEVISKIHFDSISASAELNLDGQIQNLLPGMYMVQINSVKSKLIIPFIKL